MVRLRSNRWYAADGQRSRQRVAAAHSSGTRRVISLCILLALVILLMQRASDPRHVRNAFQSLGVPLDPVAPVDAKPTVNSAERLAGAQAASGSSELASSPPGANGPATGTWQATCADVIPRILESLTVTQQRDLAEFWFGRSPTQSSKDSLPQSAFSESLDAATRDSKADGSIDGKADDDSAAKRKYATSEWAEQGSVVIESLAQQTRQSSLSSDDKQEWLTQLQEFASQWQMLCTTAASEELPAAVSSELQHALTAVLDQRLLDDLRDAAPWTQSESLAFWRLLQRTTALRTSGTTPTVATPAETPPNAAIQPATAVAPLVSMLQLDGEARSLRGQLVRFRGGVRRVERVERTYAPLHMQAGYWVLWLRGEDDAPQPVAVYTTDPQAAQLVAQIDDRDADYPQVEVRGIFAKRVAYASPAGLQVGPALFASQLIPLRSAAPPLAEVTPQELVSQFRLAVVVACLLAAVIVLPILWRNRRQQKAHRAGVGGGKGWWLLLLSGPVWPGLVASQASPASAAPPAIDVPTALLAPPWTTVKTEPLQEFLQAAGVMPLSPVTADEVRASLRDRSSRFPDALLKAIYAIRRVGWTDSLQTLEPIELGGGLALQGRAMAGWVRAANPVPLDETQRGWFQTGDQAQLYQLELQMLVADPSNEAGLDEVSGGDNEPVDAPASELLTIYSERVPQMWLSTAQLRQPSQFKTLALIDSAVPGQPALCALAAVPEWILPANLPAAELADRLAPPLAPYLMQLGQLGWDLSYLDTIQQRSQQALSRGEAPGFYSMLRLSQVAAGTAVGASDGSNGPQTQTEDAAAAQAMALLANARQSVGKPLQWRVRIVTGTVVRVTSPDDQRQLGGQAYIQYDGFVDIGNHRIRFQPTEMPAAGAQPTQPQGASQATSPLEFSGEYPVTIVAPWGDAWELGESPSAGQESWSVGQYAIVQGRFYRLWSYQSELVKSHSSQARQIAPLVVASHLWPSAPPKRNVPVNVGWFGWAMSAAMILILAAILWSATHKKRSLPS